VTYPQPVNFDSSAVQSYLTTLQSVITRMANNASACKTMCLTLVSAIVVFTADKAKPDYILAVLIPVLLFCFLDAYYLGLEQGFRSAYNEFVEKVKNDNATTQDLFKFIPREQKRQADGKNKFSEFSPVRGTKKAIKSFAIYPFYLTLFVLLMARFLLL
jgi:hypothetical protein